MKHGVCTRLAVHCAGRRRPLGTRALLSLASAPGTCTTPVASLQAVPNPGPRRCACVCTQVTVAEAMRWARDNVLTERPELFMKGDTVCVSTPGPCNQLQVAGPACGLQLPGVASCDRHAGSHAVAPYMDTAAAAAVAAAMPHTEACVLCRRPGILVLVNDVDWELRWGFAAVPPTVCRLRSARTLPVHTALLCCGKAWSKCGGRPLQPLPPCLLPQRHAASGADARGPANFHIHATWRMTEAVGTAGRGGAAASSSKVGELPTWSVFSKVRQASACCAGCPVRSPLSQAVLSIDV